MPKLTRELVREIEIGGRRVEIVLRRDGLQVRAVASRRRTLDFSWEKLLGVLTGVIPLTDEPHEDDIRAALSLLQQGEIESMDRPSSPNNAVPDLNASLGQLDTWLKKNRPRFHRALLPAAVGTTIGSLRDALPCSLPEELETLLRWHDGQDPDIHGSLVGSFYLMGAQNIIDTLEDMESEPFPGWQSGWIPFLDNDSFSYYFLDTTKSPASVRVYWDGLDEQPLEADSLAEWVAGFVLDVEAGGYVEDAERGAFLRRSE